MRVLLAKFCEYATQQANGRHSMVGMFDNIVAPFFPIDHPAFFLCLQLEFDPIEGGQPMNLRAVFMDDDANTAFDFDAQGEVPRDPGGGPTRVFVQFGVPPLRLEREGDYRLDVLFNSAKVAEERIPVRRGQPPEA